MGFLRTVFSALSLPALFLAQAAAPAAAAPGDIAPLYIPAMVVSEANFRADPSTGKPPIDTFQAGKQVLILGSTQDSQGRDWYAVAVYDDGREGFIFGNLLRPLPNFAGAPEGTAVAAVADTAEEGRLIGSHAFSLAQMKGAKPGELVVFEDLGLLYINGQQLGQGEERLSLTGWVTDVSATGFKLSGELRYRVPGLMQGECRQSGTLTFSRPAKGTAWQLDNPSACGTWYPQVTVQLRKE
jgi:hypothetical protein